MSRLRKYQADLKAAVFQEWNAGHRNVLAVAPTGAGKTVLFADVVNSVNGIACAVIAHRAELVSQMSLALAREGVRHRVIGPDTLRRQCVSLHMLELGRSFYDPAARVGACGVDSLVNKDAARDPWFSQVGLWVQDEAHHVLKENKWGRAAEMFPNAWGLGVTATPLRADGRGLGREADGLFDAMVLGPTMRDLIGQGYLTDYRIFAPPSDVDYSAVSVTPSGDYSPAKLSAAVHASSTIVGDVVGHYLKIARGKLGVTFAVDIDHAKEIAQAFNAAGVPAEVVSAKTDALNRQRILRRFKAREVLQLVNVDLFGEGFDLPAIEVVSMVRKTESYGLYVQQFGRALRLLVDTPMGEWERLTPEARRARIDASSKPRGIIIDHVGNVIRHGLPDAPREWSLKRRERRSAPTSDAVPLRICLPWVGAQGEEYEGCHQPYERFHLACPYCGCPIPPPAERKAPEFVDGDLFELDPETLQALRGEIARIDGAPRIPGHLDGIAAAGAQKLHLARQQAQARLRELIALWAGWRKTFGRTDREILKEFFFAFGVDVLTAQTFGRPEAEGLSETIANTLAKHGVTTA